MYRLRRFVNRALSTAAVVVVFLLVTFIGEQSRFMRDLDATINQSRRVYLGSAIAVFALGFIAFMGGVIYGVVTGVRSRRLRDPIPAPQQTAGGGFHIEFSFREMKEAWRSGAWLTDRWWRFSFYMMAAATVMIVGLFSVLFMVGHAGVRLVVAGALLYAVVLTSWGLMKA